MNALVRKMAADGDMSTLRGCPCSTQRDAHRAPGEAASDREAGHEGGDEVGNAEGKQFLVRVEDVLGHVGELPSDGDALQEADDGNHCRGHEERAVAQQRVVVALARNADDEPLGLHVADEFDAVDARRAVGPRPEGAEEDSEEGRQVGDELQGTEDQRRLVHNAEGGSLPVCLLGWETIRARLNNLDAKYWNLLLLLRSRICVETMSTLCGNYVHIMLELY